MQAHTTSECLVTIGANTGYNLQATASALPNNGAGESFDKALPLGILSSAISYDDWVGYRIDPVITTNSNSLKTVSLMLT